MAVVSGCLAPHATRLHSQSRAVRRGSVVAVVLDDDGMMMPMMATLDRAGDDDGVRAMMSATVVIEGNRAVLTVMKPLTLVIDDHCIRAMMSAAVVVEGNRAVFTVMKTLTLVIDDLDGLVVMAMVGCDDDVSFGCRRYRRHRYEQRQSAHDHCFHCNISIC